jgi:uncharacterized protein
MSWNEALAEILCGPGAKRSPHMRGRCIHGVVAMRIDRSFPRNSTPSLVYGSAAPLTSDMAFDKLMNSIGALALSAFLVFALGAAPVALAQERHGFSSLKEIRERGVVMQNWESSCAAAALATVLTYGFRDPVNERTVALEMLKHTEPLKVKSQGGFSLLDMKRFAESRGYGAAAYMHLSFDEMRVFHAPILLIEAKGYRHFVIFNGVRGDRALIADPAFGNREVAIDTLKQEWLDGIAFVVTPANNNRGASQ